MVIKLKNNVEDVETFLKYYYLNHFGWKIYLNSLYIISVLTPIIYITYVIKSNPEFYYNFFRVCFDISIAIVETI